MQALWTFSGFPTGVAPLDDQRTPYYVTIFECFQYLVSLSGSGIKLNQTCESWGHSFSMFARFRSL